VPANLSGWAQECTWLFASRAEEMSVLCLVKYINKNVTFVLFYVLLKYVEIYKYKILYMNLETKRLRGRPRNRWQDEVREDGRLVGGEGCKERVYNRDECTENGRKYNYQKSIIYEFGNKEAER
jgi:hypothetical protein